MRAGDILQVDFGTPARGEAGFVRAVVITSDDVLEFHQMAVVVVPCTMTRRGWLTEIEVEGFGVAQAHLPTSISLDRIVRRRDQTSVPLYFAKSVNWSENYSRSEHR